MVLRYSGRIRFFCSSFKKTSVKSPIRNGGFIEIQLVKVEYF